jgi:hypothetical protein
MALISAYAEWQSGDNFASWICKHDYAGWPLFFCTLRRSLPMSSAFPQHPEIAMVNPSRSQETNVARGWIGWSSFIFAVLQSVCTFLAAMAGLRLAIGIGSLALSAGAGAALDQIHTNWIRVPMISLALIGSLLNLIAILRLRRLRNRPASSWRQKPVTMPRGRMEQLQLVLPLGTLALIVLEDPLGSLSCLGELLL